MSTRANIVIQNRRYSEMQVFYRHCDGYPDRCDGNSGPIPLDLDRLCDWIREGRLRDNVGQMSGWLVVLGHMDQHESRKRWDWIDQEENVLGSPEGDWKVGHYEPSAWGIHGDVEYVYVLDLDSITWSCHTQGEYLTEYGPVNPCMRRHPGDPSTRSVLLEEASE